MEIFLLAPSSLNIVLFSKIEILQRKKKLNKGDIKYCES